ncbi:hypothetical protein EMIHUDRAFT_448732 [Emiliania huxleyi CCMP1516]|uniref:ABC transmembrane type-1 domain-containing protein n=2 Tax=Emiliania huxleyi TaxID=2903 RepID=A0A0D3KZQ7_EMIH1|nr:hypothetical protein EMIHUDRAFT_448732 [Emiliania huxleyi CCMP1516]EOD41242.1 hypothetical protein EMIHUDRAFT_448732 [Emiliania huxleyi CCMP1516]|eukprot:XP_005793671.1 hypothetical protein EMIHUDRAFT_448732 [Emiliania huxleyi CCMP1516]
MPRPYQQQLDEAAPVLKRRSSESARLAKFVRTTSEPGAIGDRPRTRQAIEPAVSGLIAVLRVLLPLYWKMYAFGYSVLSKLPTNAMRMVFGAALCLFGGHFFASVAAIEAFRIFGWEQLRHHVGIVVAEAQSVADASRKDNDVDADENGVADVDEMTSRELLRHKTALAMSTVQDPQRLQAAAGFLWAAYVSVLATLRLEFARTISLALACAEMFEFPITRCFLPGLVALLGPDLQHWGTTIIQSALALVTTLVAIWLQTAISAFYAAVRGGRMFAEGLFALMEEHGLFTDAKGLPKLPCFKEGWSPEDSTLDEAASAPVVGFTLAGCGFLYQVTTGFELPFPLNLVFLPLTAVEWLLRWQIYVTDEGLLL